MKTASLLIRLARPLFLLGGILLFALGAGIAHFLGANINWQVYLIGQLWGSMLQLSTHFLNEYFDYETDLENKNRTWITGGSGALGPEKLPRVTALWGAIASLAAVASFTVMLLQVAHPSPETILFMILLFLGAFFYAAPPLQLESTGYGELDAAIITASLIPGFSLLLQVHSIHRLLPMATFPLILLGLAMLLAFDLPDYYSDVKQGKRTLLVRMGWQAGMNLHNILVLAAFLLFGVAVALGLPIAVAGPAFIGLPFGLLQIWMMNRIANGGKPNWNALTLNALLLFAVPAYLLTFSFWTH